MSTPPDNEEVVVITSTGTKLPQKDPAGREPMDFGSGVPRERFAQDKPDTPNPDEEEVQEAPPSKAPPGSTMGYKNEPAFRGQFDKDRDMIVLGPERLRSFCMSDPSDKESLDKLHDKASDFDPKILMSTVRTDFHEGKHYVLVRHQDVLYPYYDHEYRDTILASYHNR